MSRSRRPFRPAATAHDAARWIRWLPWVSLGAFSACWAARWPTFPLLLDPCYHLFIARQLVDAGGPMLYEWWEYAPGGRPHLYPPLLHLLLAGLLRLGAPPLSALRLVSVALLPGLLLSVFLVTRRLCSPRTALACLWMGMLPFSFHLASAMTMAATLGMIQLLWLMLAVERDRPVAAGLLLALLCYTHLALPWVAMAMLGCYGALRPAAWRRVARSSWGLLLAVPWYAHAAHHLPSFQVVPRWENALVELVPALSAVAAVGIVSCWRLNGRFSWFLACEAGFLLLAPRHAYRWLSGEGMLPTILLAGAGAERLSQWLARVRSNRGEAAVRERQQLLAVAALVAILACAPTLARHDSGWQWRWPDSAPWHLVGASAGGPKRPDLHVASRHVERWAQDVARHSEPNEILWSNAPYAGGLVAAVAHRPLASAMLPEVLPTQSADPLSAAHLILWFKFDPLPGGMTPSQLTRYALTRVSEDEMAVLFRQDGVRRLARRPEAVLPFGAVMLLLGCGCGLLCWDLGRTRQAGPTSV